MMIAEDENSIKKSDTYKLYSQIEMNLEERVMEEDGILREEKARKSEESKRKFKVKLK